MKLKQKLLTALLSFCLVLLGFFVLHSGLAQAANVDPASLCVPKYKKGTDSSHSAVDGWLTAQFINRATVLITYHPNGNCATPPSADSKFLYQTGDITFNDVFQNISGKPGQLVVVDNDTSDGNFDYRAGVGDNADDTRVDQFGGLGGATDDGFGGHDKQLALDQIKSYLGSSEVTLSFEEDKVFKTSDAGSPAPASLGCSDGKNQNFVLNGNGHPNWFCQDSKGIGGGVGGTSGFQIGADNYSSLGNFNITYFVQGEGTSALVINVSKSMQKDRTFKWCPTAPRPGGGKGLFLNHSCINPDLVLTNPDGSAATPANINSLGTGQGKFTVKKYENGVIGATVSSETVEGSKGESAQFAGYQNDQNQGVDQNGGGSDVAANSAGAEACEVKSVGFPLRWLLCPLLDGANAAAEQLRITFEQQLSFTIHDTSNPTKQAATSGVSDAGLKNLKTAWSIIRLIASTLIIIILLIMVLSEAMDGPFDAYTVRKVLPRLVVAVILMQISWIMFIWFVDRIDDLGRVIANIMYQPFGGTAKLNNLWALLNNAHAGVEAGVFSWIGLIGIIIAAKFALPMVLLFCFIALIAIMTGLLVLIFRKIIIIMGLIFMPLALLFWILPGTEPYWKFYRENLTKALFMFPLVVALIAAGRIFASIATVEANGTLINFLIVLVGFFGPIFILPKTFQWGGSLMNMAGNAAFKSSQGLRGWSRKYAGGIQQQNALQRANNRAARLAYGESAVPRWDRMWSGGYNFLRTPSSRRRQYASTMAAGREEAEKAAQEAIVGSGYETAKHEDKLKALFAAAQGQTDPTTRLSGHNSAVRRWAMDKLAEYGDWDAISNLRSGGHVDQADWESFVAKNISAIHQKAPHLSPLRPDLSELAAEDIPNWHTHSVQELVDQVTNNQVRDPKNGSIKTLTGQDAVNQRVRAIQMANHALTSPYINGRLTSEQREALTQITNLGTTELLAHEDQGIAHAAQLSYGRQIASGRLSAGDQARFEDNMVDMRTKAAASPEARAIYNQVMNEAQKELTDRVTRTVKEAVGQNPSLSAADIAVVRNNIETKVAADRARLAAKGLMGPI